ncbi:uncharacterized protein LOC143300654 [Babylonia areolata]|uniref:uncharacterized protein LOC143300654 n=1 Tax=Babylonia areolata TaxID=304850 RepID=UPI003FD0A941
MEWTVLSCVVLAIAISIETRPVVSSPQEDDKALPPDPCVVSNNDRTAAALLQLQDYVKHGDAVVKERVNDLYSNLKEQLKEGDKLLKDRMEEGLTHEKEERKEGDERLKEELQEDVAWLKEKQTKEQRRLEEELAEGEAKMNEEIAELKEAFKKLRNSVQQCTQPAVTEDMKQQISDIQAELNCTQNQLQTAQTAHQEKLDLIKTDLQSTRQAVRSLKASGAGSSFVRWGNSACPDNTSLVYSGVAGGTRTGHSGGASNYLCLGMTPQFDNTSAPSRYNNLRGAEYGDVEGRDSQDVLCSVCRAPQPTTLMMPATLVCPAGWTAQYSGHLMSERLDSAGRTEYVCVDGDMKYRLAGGADKLGAQFFYVMTVCDGTLPCPPYQHLKPVTCVVCSL